MILVMGGTADGRALVRQATERGHAVIVTTSTEYGAQLLADHGQRHVQAERLDHDGLTAFIHRHHIDTLIDATHPYAEVASRTAIDVCRATGCRYLRYERAASYLDDFTGTLIRVADYRQAVQWAAQWAQTHDSGQVFLTTGSKTLEIFINALGVDRIVARVLPTVDVIRKCQQLGLPASRIVAMQGPFSHALNTALIAQFDIRLLVTKDSGETGGMPEKLSAAVECALPVVLIERPAIDYPNCYHDMEGILTALSPATDAPTSTH